jgi:hypothetical protein
LRSSLLGRVARNTDHARVLTTFQPSPNSPHRQANAQNPFNPPPLHPLRVTTRGCSGGDDVVGRSPDDR